MVGHRVLFFALVTVVPVAYWCYRSPARLNPPTFVVVGVMLLGGLALVSAGFRVPAGLSVGGSIVSTRGDIGPFVAYGRQESK